MKLIGLVLKKMNGFSTTLDIKELLTNMYLAEMWRTRILICLQSIQKI